MSEEENSAIVIEFVARGSAEFQVSMNQITPGQLFAAAAYLTWLAQFEATRINTPAASQIAIPK